jgi:uncharacterized membrane protein
MADIDTSPEAVKRLIIEIDGLPAFAAHNATLRALVAERDRLREALEDIADRFDLADCEITQDARTARDIARAALGETGHE